MIARVLLFGAFLMAPNLHAGPLPALFFEGAPDAYVPGEPFTVQVGVPPITDLGAYNVDIALTSDTGDAGTDFLFDVAATVPATTDYVFPSSANFFDAANVDSPSQHRITLSDFDFTGVDVTADVNDMVAILTILTSADFDGDLSLSFDVGGLILDTPAVTPTPVDQFTGIFAATRDSPSLDIRPIPEPATAIGAAILLGWLLTIQRKRARIARVA